MAVCKIRSINLLCLFVCPQRKRFFDRFIPIISVEALKVLRLNLRLGRLRVNKRVRCNIPKRPARGGGSWGMVAGAVDGELIAEPGRRRGFAAELYDSFPF